MAHSKNYYELLGVPPTADGIILRRAFRKLSKAFHPDTTFLPKSEAEKKFREICEAYEVLTDPHLRKLYDRSILQPTHNQEYSKIAVEFNKIKPNQEDQIIELRRPLSGGELFALFILLIVLLGSFFLAIGFALLQGEELLVRPSWLCIGSQLHFL